MTGVYLLNFLARVIMAPLMPVVERDLSIGHGEAGSLFLFISLGYFTGLLGSGFVSSRFTHRQTIVLSSVAVGGSLIAVSLTHTLLWIRCGLTMVGLSAGLYPPSGIATLTDMVDSRDWGKAMALHELSPILAFVTAPLLAEGLMVWFPWRGVVALLGGTAVAAGGAFARFGRGGTFSGEDPHPKNLRILFTQPSFSIMMVLFSVGIGASLGVYTVLPLYLVAERGFERGLANTLVGLSRIAGLGVVFLAGWATDRLGPRRALIGVFLATGTATMLLGIVRGAGVIPALFLQPVLASCFFPAGLAAVSKISPPQFRNVAVALTIAVGFLLGGGAIPAGIGFMGEHGLFPLGIVLVGVLLVLSVIFVHYLKFQEDAIEGG